MDYREIFSHRGQAYHQAMTDCPQARRREFELPLEKLSLFSGAVLADFPSGGGYLKQFLSHQVEVIPLETTTEFGDESGEVQLGSWDGLPLAEQSVDRFLSLAALHHTNQRLEFYKEVHRVLKPAGRFVIGDVQVGTPQAEFLNGFVDAHNSMGHHGDFLQSGRETERLQEAGFQVEEEDFQQYEWAFQSQDEMVSFCRGLFGLDKATATEIREGLSPLLNAPDSTTIQWSLLFLTAVKSK